VLVSDLCLPGPNGLQVIQRMHAEDPDLPVILTTGLENTKDILTSAESYGATACLKKPMNVDDLMWEIERALAISRQRGRRPGMPLVHLARRPAPPHAI
jgi:two-component system C4-dicarboxylate transport response regulator DctD